MLRAQSWLRTALALGLLAAAPPALGQGWAVRSADDLLRLDAAALDALYRGGRAVVIPPGPIRGRAIPRPGSRLNPALSRAGGLAWQGKVIRDDGASAVNRFFGARVVEGRLYAAESWLDGGPALVLDYAGTSHVYRNYRDEIREVAPGVYLGLMYERSCPAPTLKMYFALDACR